MTTPTDTEKLSQALADSAFHFLQHDTGPQDEEYRFLHALLIADFLRILGHPARAQPASVADVPWVAISNAVRAYERTVGEYPKAKDRTTLRKQCRAIHEWLAAAPQPPAKESE